MSTMMQWVSYVIVSIFQDKMGAGPILMMCHYRAQQCQYHANITPSVNKCVDSYAECKKFLLQMLG